MPKIVRPRLTEILQKPINKIQAGSIIVRLYETRKATGFKSQRLSCW